jgi:AcrR family transcriptional regulator
MPIIAGMNATLTRKQREVKERERQILELARAMIVRDGYHGLSMDRIAEEIEYSKGTVYLHFKCKEDILMALVNQTTERRLDLFERAAAYRGRSRERITAIGAAAELFFELYPDHIHTEQMIRINSIRDKTSEERRRTLETCEARCSEVVRGVMRDAVAAGDLPVSDEFGIDQLSFGLWAITFGAYSIAITSPSLANLGIHNPVLAIRENCIRLLDGAGWKPLSFEEDLTKLMDPIKQQVFGPELAKIRRLRPA